ncbi:hypothetical protein chiPu_0020556 [Chiloscyllium punctatum]|uniref:Uncharacterized protein n=1 Tax=Chiloscyllium punctatum TaxID=137246 RepID=A0A401RGY4_CHIPU|nr:hypothetical protein [Chiloscyllium punctatum]
MPVKTVRSVFPNIPPFLSAGCSVPVYVCIRVGGVKTVLSEKAGRNEDQIVLNLTENTGRKHGTGISYSLSKEGLHNTGCFKSS